MVNNKKITRLKEKYPKKIYDKIMYRIIMYREQVDEAEKAVLKEKENV